MLCVCGCTQSSSIAVVKLPEMSGDFTKQTDVQMASWRLIMEKVFSVCLFLRGTPGIGNSHFALSDVETRTCCSANALLGKCVSPHLAAGENVAVSGRTSTTGHVTREKLTWMLLSVIPVRPFHLQSPPSGIECVLEKWKMSRKMCLFVVLDLGIQSKLTNSVRHWGCEFKHGEFNLLLIFASHWSKLTKSAAAASLSLKKKKKLTFPSAALFA